MSGRDIASVTWHRRLTVRLTAGVVLVLLAIGVPFLLVFHRLQQQREIAVLGEAAGSLSRVLVDALRISMVTGEPDLLKQAARDVARQPEVERVVILDRHGRVKVTSDPAFEERVFRVGHDALCRACHEAGSPPLTSRTSATREEGRRILRAMSTIPNEERCHRCHDATAATNGVLVVDLALRKVDAWFFADIGRTVAVGIVMVLITIAALVWLLRRMVHRPLGEVVATSRRIVGGELDARVPVRRGGEFALLADHVNHMTDHLARSLENVERHRRELRAILDAVGDEIVVLKSDRSVAVANEAFQRKTAPRGGGVIGRDCREVSGAHWPCTAENPDGCPVDRVFQSRRMEKSIVCQTSPDGRERAMEIHASPVLGQRGEVTRVVEVRRDISERRQLEASLVHSERLASIGLLASGISHEVNNPLGSIAARAEGIRRWLTDLPDIPEEARTILEEGLETIARETGRGRAITDRLLNVVRPGSARRSLIDVNHTAKEIVALLASTMRKANIEPQTQLGNGLPPLVGDESELAQVLMNLVLNAIQAMESGGGHLRIVTARGNGAIRIEVEDTGEGIPQAILGRIYDPFFTTKPTGKGTGLGLFIVHRIVTELGGKIQAQSRPREGTKFTVLLPTKEEEGSRDGS